MNRRFAPITVIIVALIAACATPKAVQKGPETTAPASGAANPTPEAVPPTEVSEASVRGTEFSPSGDTQAVHFDYDSYALNEAARSALKKNADYLKGRASLDVLAAGNCDERGTVAYNLALGQKRAKAVRDFYIRLGVPGKRIATISYGKEKPSCTESNETCWAQNRRTDTLLRAQAGK